MIRSLQDFLLGVSATDRELLHELEGKNPDAQIHRKRAGWGGAILLTFLATWAFTAWTATTFEAGIYVSLASGLLAGLLKLVWDRQVGVATSTGLAWGRVGLGGLISVVMATPVALFLFGDFAVDASKKEERQSITNTYEEKLNDRTTLGAEIDSLRVGQSLFQTLAKVEEGGLTQREAGLTDEQLQRYGVMAPPSGKQGCGDRCETYQRRAQGYESALEAKKQELSALPTREELRDRREKSLTELEQETKNAVTRLIELYRKELSESWFSLGVFLVLVFMFAVADLLPVMGSLLGTDLYTKVQKAQNKGKERKRAIERAQEQGELRKTRAATWMEAIIITRILEEADSNDVPLERLKELADKLDEFREREDSLSEEQEQWPMDKTGGDLRSEGMSGEYPDLRPSASAGDGAPSPEEESDGPDAPRENGRLLLPPANGQEES